MVLSVVANAFVRMVAHVTMSLEIVVVQQVGMVSHVHKSVQVICMGKAVLNHATVYFLSVIQSMEHAFALQDIQERDATNLVQMAHGD
jgi:hypothetical protein